MVSSTAAQVRIQPRMIQPRYGNTGDAHGACRSRRITRPMLTALSETMAKAMVMEADGCVVLGSSGPQASTARRARGDDEPGDDPADDLRRVDDLRAGLARRPLHDAGVGNVDDEPDHHGDDDEELREQQLEREERDTVVDVQDRREDHQLQHRRQDRQLQLDVGGDASVDVAAQVDGAHEGGEVVVGQHDLRRLLGHLRAAAHGDADVGLLEGGRVVHRVAGHRDHFTRLLHEPRQPQLVLRRHPAEDVQLGAAGRSPRHRSDGRARCR